MATRYAVASGVFSNTATWNGGTLPTSADDIYTNNFNVTVDQDITAITLRNISNVSPAIAAGGQFIVTGSTGTRVITLTDITSGVRSNSSTVTTTAIVINSTSGATVTINTNFNNTGLSQQQGIFCNGNCTVNIVGSSTGVYGSFFSNNTNANGGTLNIVGNISGNIFAGSGSLILGATNYTTNITGNVTGNAGWCITTNSTTINITGNVFGSTDNAIAAVSSCVINITGNITSGAAQAIGGGSATATAGNITVTVNGNITSSSTAVAISTTNVNSTVTVNGNLINTSDVMALYSPKMRISPTAQQTWTFQTAGPNRQMFTANAFSGGTMPAASDVRLGVSYAGGSLSGTCAVPSANSVAFGVPVDATTGTSLITRAQFLTDLGTIAAGYPQI
jgi:hypothetical protein